MNGKDQIEAMIKLALDNADGNPAGALAALLLAAAAIAVTTDTDDSVRGKFDAAVRLYRHRAGVLDKIGKPRMPS